jgi:hypothetical protein
MQVWGKALTTNHINSQPPMPIQCHTNGITAYQYLRGYFDYNKTLLAPMGCAEQMHKSRDRQEHIPSMGGILELHLSTIDATSFIQKEHEAREHQTQFSSKQNTEHNQHSPQPTGFHPVWDTVLPDVPHFFVSVVP